MSFSPIYNQPVIWVAEYTDGTLLREWDDSGKEHLFREIDRSKLKNFHLVSKDFDYFFQCNSGIFVIDGREFVFPLSGMALDYAAGLIQFKDATTEFVPVHRKLTEYDGFEITSFNIGWKAEYGNVKTQVLLSIPEKVFTVEITLLDIQKSISWKVKL